MKRDQSEIVTRRSLLRLAPAAATVVLMPSAFTSSAFAQKKEKEEAEDDVSTNEDLMREHGILKRTMLCYDEIIRRVNAGKDFSPQNVTDAANIIKKFIEEYHEKLEEEHLFPRFRKADKLVDLVDTLLTQHKAGRAVTARVLTAAASLKSADDKKKLAADLAAFNRMYSPHEAREDTVLFPELHKIVSKHEYDALGEQFDKIEHDTFGQDGFDLYLAKVTKLEKDLGIYDLKQFTPK